MKIWLVTADAFHDFGKRCGTLTMSQARERLLLKTVSHSDVFIPAQGMCTRSRQELYSLAQQSGFGDSFRNWGIDCELAPNSLTHKRRMENTLISTPQLLSDGSFSSELQISGDNELIIDHLTGQHVQGMILIEACRQMFIAVSELAHMRATEKKCDYVIFNAMNVSFKAFTYPLPAQVVYREMSLLTKRPDRVGVVADITIFQNNIETTKLSVDYTLFEKQVITSKEIEKGQQAVAEYQHRIMAAELQQSEHPDSRVA